MERKGIGVEMNGLTLRSRRHLERMKGELRVAERLNGPQRQAVLRGAARQLMQAGFHNLAKDIRQHTRKDLK